MPKNNVEKNTKGTKKTATKVEQKKVASKTNTNTEKKVAKKESNSIKKATPKKVVEEKKVEVKEVIKPSKKEENKLFNKIISNTPFLVSLCIILILVAILIFMLCNKRIPKTSNGEEIVASIKGKNITATELYEKLKEDHGTDALISIIDDYITDKEVTVTDEDKDYVEGVVDYYKEYAEYYQTDLATFLANYMGLSGITTEDEFYDFVMEDYKKSLAVKKYIADNAKEDDLKEYYENNYSDSLTVKHILIEVDSEAEDKEAANTEAYETAKSLIKKLDKVEKEKLEKKFEDYVEKYSDDTATYSTGGAIENFTKSSVVEEFWNASYELENGEYTSEPVKTSYGYHVILKISSTPVEKYEDIKDDVKNKYAEHLLSSDSSLQVEKWDELRKQYKLAINDDFIKELYEKVITDAKNSSEK